MTTLNVSDRKLAERAILAGLLNPSPYANAEDLPTTISCSSQTPPIVTSLPSSYVSGHVDLSFGSVSYVQDLAYVQSLALVLPLGGFQNSFGPLKEAIHHIRERTLPVRSAALLQLANSVAATVAAKTAPIDMNEWARRIADDVADAND